MIEDKQRREGAEWARQINERNDRMCPVKDCKLYSVRRYEDRNSIGLVSVSPEVALILANAGYGNNPAIHSHIAESHADILLALKQATLRCDFSFMEVCLRI